MDWCGAFGPRAWLGHTLSPCWLESGSAALLVALVLPVLALGAARIWRAEAAAAAAGLVGHARGITGLEFGIMATTLTLAALHAIHLAVVLSVAVLRALPFHTAYHAAGLAVWACTGVATWRASASRTALDLRALVVAAELLYIASVYAYFCVYLGGPAVLPPTYLRSQVRLSWGWGA